MLFSTRAQWRERICRSEETDKETDSIHTSQTFGGKTFNCISNYRISPPPNKSYSYELWRVEIEGLKAFYYETIEQ